MRYLVFIIALFAALQTNAQNNIVYGAGINYTNGAPTFTPPVRTSRVAIDTVTGKWYHFNTPGGWQLIGNTIEEIAGCTAPAYIPGKGDSKVVINNCSPQPELYFWNGSAWVLVGGGSVFAGEGIRIENDTIILDSLNFLDFRTGNALDGDVGRVQWNDTDGTLDLNLKGGNVTLQIGQEEVSLVKHADNSGLIEGRVVYIVGSDGANKTVRYALADSDATSATTFGLMTESATGGNKAFCTTFGLVRNLNTTNLTEGGIVWLSADTAGTMTAVRPTAPEHGVMIGFCVRKHATQGAIFVQVQNGYELNELHDVFVPSPTNGQVLTWNSTNARWEAITPANQLQTLSTDGSAGNISISSGNTITLNVNDADASTTNELQTLSTGTNTLTLSNGGGTVTVDTNPSDDVTGSGTSGQVSFWTGAQTQSGDNNLFWNNSTKRLGVGVSNPTALLDMASSGIAVMRVKGGTGTNQGSAHYFTAAGSSSTLFAYGDEAAIVGGTPDLSAMIWSNTSIPLKFRLGGSSTPQFTFTANGRLLLGTTTDDGFRLNVSGDSRFTNNLNVGTTSNVARLHVVGSGTSSSTWTAQFHNSAGNNNALMIRDDGNVGIGTSTMNGKLNIDGGTSFGVYQSGSNVNYFQGGLAIGNTSDLNGYNLRILRNVGGLASSFSIFNETNFLSTVTTTGHGYTTSLSTQAASFNLNFIYHYRAQARAFGAGSTVGTQAAFFADGTLSGANNNYGFQGVIPAAANNFNLYMSSTAKNYLNGQLGIGTTTPNASAAFEVASTTQGVLFPRMTTTERNAIATPADGLVIYNTTDNKLQVRAGGAWVDLH